jgi:hypothetical protein
MKKILLISITAICLTNFPLAAQDNSTSTPAYAGGLFENFGVAFKVTPDYGIGFDFMTALHPNIKLRLGCSYFINFKKVPVDKDFDGTSLDGTERDVPIHVEDISLDILNGNLLIDFFPWRKAGFHITLGAYVGKTNIDANASAPEAFDVEGYVIRPNANGKFKASLQLGNIVKPYFGIGFGRTIPQKRVGFMFDLGMIYHHGPYQKILSNNMDTSDFNHELNNWVKDLDIPAYITPLVRFCPVMSFSLIYRIK